MPGYTVGMLAQEPPLNEREDRPRQHRGGGRRDQGEAGPVQRDRRADGHRLLRRADGGDGPAPGGARPRRRLGRRLPARAGDGRAALPAAGRRRHPALRWRAPPGGAVQAAAGAARPAAARRAHQPPRRRERALAGAAPGQVRRHRHRDHPRPVLPRQRRRVDPRARPRPHLPVRGQLLHVPGEEGRSASQSQGRKDAKLQKRLTEELEWVRSNAKARQTKSRGPAGPLRGDGRRGGEDPQARLRGDPDPAGPAPGQHGHRGARTCARASATGC